MGAAAARRYRAHADIVRLAHRCSDLEELAKGCALRWRVPVTLDPATLLPTRCVVENGLPPAATLRHLNAFKLHALGDRDGELRQADSSAGGGDDDRPAVAAAQ